MAARRTYSESEFDYGERLAVLECQNKADQTALRARTKYLEWRLEMLNGEAGRLKAAAETSVTREKFDDYINTQRLKEEARQNSQEAAFKAYSNKIEERLASINVKLATWGGALIVVIAVIQYLIGGVKS